MFDVVETCLNPADDGRMILPSVSLTIVENDKFDFFLFPSVKI